MPRLIPLLILCCLLPGLAAQQSTNDRVLARAELSNATIEIGDQVTLTVNISVPPGVEMSGLDPAYIPDLESLEIIREGKLNTVTKTPELLLQQQFVVTTFDTGYVAVPPMPYVFREGGRLDTAFTNDLLLTIQTPPGQDGLELQPIKPIIREPRNWRDFWWLYLVILVGAAGYAFYAYRSRQQRVQPPPPPPPPAHEVARQQLTELEQQELWQRGETKAYYSELTRILRGYLAGRFSVPALEMTTRQLTTELRNRPDFADERTGELSQLLQLSDLVKFAKARPAAELHPESLERVRTFVDATAPLPVTDTPTVAEVFPPQNDQE